MRKMLGVLLLAALPLHASADDAGKPVIFRAEAKVTIDANGKPVSVEASKDLPDAIRAYIEKRVYAWSFQPPQLDGKAVGGMTYVHLGACAVPTAGGYSLAIDYKDNGPGYANDYGMLPPPRYPPNALRAGQVAAVKVTYVVETDGATTVESTEFLGHPPSNIGVRKDFSKAVSEWAAHLRYVPEQLDGKLVRTRLSVPLTFTLDGDQVPGYKAPEHPYTKEYEYSHECRMASEQQKGPMPIAEDSPFKLLGQGS